MSAQTQPQATNGGKPVRRVTLSDIAKMHAEGVRIPMLTAYDYPTARVVDEAGVPLILVGDSLGMVMLGYEETVRVSMEEMLHHTKAVVRGTRRILPGPIRIWRPACLGSSSSPVWRRWP